MKRFASAVTSIILSLPFFASCSGSKSDAAAQEEGAIRGKVEQVLHHGAFNPDGPNRTVTPLAGIGIIVADTVGRPIDTLFSDSTGTFGGAVGAGIYLLTAPERPTENESVPGSSPPPERVTIRSGETAEVLFRYNIYAP